MKNDDITSELFVKIKLGDLCEEKDTNSITVVTLTRGRPNLLSRAVASVKSQNYKGLIQHLILTDDDDNSTNSLKLTKEWNVDWISIPREKKDHRISRVARLRNMAIRISKCRWICFLDDDNEWLPNHLTSLVACALRNGLRAVHSFREIYNQDGSPFLGFFHPWIEDYYESRNAYQILALARVFEPGTNIVRMNVNSRKYPHWLWTVDMGEWLLDRELLLEVPIHETFKSTELSRRVGEDDKLLEDLLTRGEKIGCTCLPTLRYYLGGFSNTFIGSHNVRSISKV